MIFRMNIDFLINQENFNEACPSKKYRQRYKISPFRTSRPEVFCKKGALRDFARFTCQSLFFNKFTGLRPGILSKKRLWHKYFFPVDFAKFLRTHFFHRKPLVAAFVL